MICSYAVFTLRGCPTGDLKSLKSRPQLSLPYEQESSRWSVIALVGAFSVIMQTSRRFVASSN